VASPTAISQETGEIARSGNLTWMKPRIVRGFNRRCGLLATSDSSPTKIGERSISSGVMEAN